MKPEVHGHRGARAVRPENSLAGFAHALDLGADAVELDVVVSRDNRLLVAHDLRPNPAIHLAPGRFARAWFREMTGEEIMEIDCGSLVSNSFPKQRAVPGEKIPALGQVLELIRARTGSVRAPEVNVELKSLPRQAWLTPPPEEYAALVLQELEAHSMLSRALVQSFDHRIIKEIKRQSPSTRTSALVAATVPDLVSMAGSALADHVSLHKDWVDKDTVEAIHRAGIRLLVWTANTRDDWKYLVDLGVDGLITDDPGGLLDFLRTED